MRRLTLLCTNLARGGAETQVALLAMAMARRGWQVNVASLLPPTAFAEELAENGIEVWSAGMKPGRIGPWALLRVLIYLRKKRPAILHTHLFHANLLARVLRLLCPVPVLVSTIHSLAESGRESADVSWRDRSYRATDWLADATVCVSDAVARRHLESNAVSKAKIRVIPNGAEPATLARDAAERAHIRQELGIGEEFVWLAAGRLMWKKDYPTMLEAMARQRNAVLLVAGDGPVRGELEALASNLGARVQFLGLRDDVTRLMNAADALVLSSVVEGLPMVLIEAAFAGLPCVATDAGGVREVVADGKSGFVVPVRDSEALAAAMDRLATMPAEARRALGSEAQRLAEEQFSLDRIAARWESLYEESMVAAERWMTA